VAPLAEEDEVFPVGREEEIEPVGRPVGERLAGAAIMIAGVFLIRWAQGG